MPTKNDDAVEVAKVKGRAKVITGRPRKILTASAMRAKVAFPSTGGMIGGAGGNFYSPELSTDFLELPQSLDEQRNYYRFFYKTDPFVGQAVDLHTELPLSKVRLGMPKAKNRKLAEKALAFCEKWAAKHKLLHRLIEIVHEYNLLGEVFIFMEDASPDMPEDVTHEIIREIHPDGKLVERTIKRKDAEERAGKWLKKNYKGWTAIRVLPPEQIHMESFPFTDEKIIELIPDSKTKNLIGQANAGDEQAERIVKSMPKDVVDAILEGRNIPLNTDPEAGSFVYYMCRKKSQYEPRGHSVLERCLLPGTPIWVSRQGILQQIPVEAINPEMDLALTHTGKLAPIKAGFRPVDEAITLLDIDGLPTPIRLTSDHEVLRVSEDGTESWVKAGDLRKGDVLREAHYIPQEPPKEVIDLPTWWKGRAIPLGSRRGRSQKNRTITASEAVFEDGQLKVSFAFQGDNAGATAALPKMQRLLDWLKSLGEPQAKSCKEVGAITGLTSKEVRAYAHKFRKEIGLQTTVRSLGRGKGQQTTWMPLHSTAKVPGSEGSVTFQSPVGSIQVTEDFCYLLGTWLGDGCVWTHRDGGLNAKYLEWSLHEKYPRVRDRVRDTVAKVFPTSNVVQGSIYATPSGKDNLHIQDALLARFFHDEFGHGAEGKRLPQWVFSLPDEHLLCLLRGLSDTDGCVRLGKYASVEITLKNPILVDQIHLLCSRLGIHTSVGISQKKASTWASQWETKAGTKTRTYLYPPRTYAKISCTRTADVLRWIKGSAKSPEGAESQQVQTKASRFRSGWLTRVVNSVSQEQYKGNVHSFDVSGDHSHVTGVVTHNCMRTLVYRDKLRQAQTSIASRHMTPMRVVSAENMDANDTEELRNQVDLALADPDYSIITNFEINWQEMGSQGRLLDLTSEYDLTDRQLYAGLGTTESMLSGESSYSGDRINIEIVNTRYMLLREIVQDLVEQHMFKPMCARMGFIEQDDDGEDEVIFPSMTFTRLGLRDNADTFDHLFSLYQKGSLDVDIILELLNVDPVMTKKKIERDMWTPNDPTFNEVTRNVYSTAAQKIVDGTDVVQKISENMGLKYKQPTESSEDRF